ncbi:MAG: hypothetical protein IJ934_07925 [Acetobacter sp.]|nr:hypothetical protein [Acetobacter sp.]
MKKFIIALAFCLSLSLVGCGKKMPEPNRKTCSFDYLAQHKSLYRRLLNYQRFYHDGDSVSHAKSLVELNESFVKLLADTYEQNKENDVLKYIAVM